MLMHIVIVGVAVVASQSLSLHNFNASFILTLSVYVSSVAHRHVPVRVSPHVVVDKRPAPALLHQRRRRHVRPVPRRLQLRVVAPAAGSVLAAVSHGLHQTPPHLVVTLVTCFAQLCYLLLKNIIGC